MIWVLIPRAVGSHQRIPIGRDKLRCAFKLTTVIPVGICGRDLEWKNQFKGFFRSPGKDSDLIRPPARILYKVLECVGNRGAAHYLRTLRYGILLASGKDSGNCW